MKAKRKGEKSMEREQTIEVSEIEALVAKAVKRHKLIFQRLDEL